MRNRIGTLSDRLLNAVAPKRTASAINCWQFEACYQNACSGGRDLLYEVDPCNDGQRYSCVRSC
ncbi:hypothetical protein I2W78_37620 [Streptomyces spinoverrucosus]|uniref:hypothetical protein n=1 Tax=Streptomyces spinoverrucosus TaxID=284043 RepID=UPI0018C408C0|nr:hypothetical protein [Streptomyces spinoverrucosus]MBG0857416.1 hypothetical protein [Streptomyces spinoverrucosus]